ncbi:MAG: hypothetical protein DIZ80_14795 [endosymbiont of Galathealinum brachiosum]|uniref:Uncharacterized protein n=1 Tax=endosymbiont of Galathealinum brachiosum TaxID=2200906 RepID=A0A370D8Z1_9GAMM|nr:MAG: hypothetical protein DIZ80_14795 [endosymbiont of Galathealinum brachiosum]
MGDVIKFKKPKPSEKHKGNMLCKRNFHKWEIDQEKQFDVKQGRLVTVYKCMRCGIFKTEAK